MSTAALSHDRRRVPDDAEPLLQDGYFCTTLDLGNYIVFNVVDASNTRLASVSVYKQRKAWSGRIERSYIVISMAPSEMTPPIAVCLAEVLGLAAVFTEALDADIAELERKQREQMEAERKKRDEERAREREERVRLLAEQEKELEPLKEFLQWNLEEKIRYKKAHHRSTIFGTVKALRVQTYGGTFLDTISERGIPMTVRLKDILWLDHKEQGSSRYDRIYTNPDQTGIIS